MGEIYKKRELQKSSETKLATFDCLHYPDLYFYKWCNEHFRINRGVLNTIDCWLYTNEVIDLYKRRILILQFLKHVAGAEYNPESKSLKFGKGKLVTKLSAFVAQYKHPVS